MLLIWAQAAKSVATMTEADGFQSVAPSGWGLGQTQISQLIEVAVELQWLYGEQTWG